MGSYRRIIAFLGNPGKEYEVTRHNAGFLCADYIAQKRGFKIDRVKFRSLCGEMNFNGEKVLILKPQTFMNLSGEAIRDALSFYKLEAKTGLTVVYDDMYIGVGKIRIREKGSDGGHKGINNIIYQLASTEFARVKVGVGKPTDNSPARNWVLGNIPSEERELFLLAFHNTEKAIELIADGKILDAMNKFN